MLYLATLDISMKTPQDTAIGQASVIYTRPEGDCLLIRLAGGWTLKDGIPSIDEFSQQITGNGPIRLIRFDGGDITRWDTSLLAFLTRIIGDARQQGIEARSRRSSRGRPPPAGPGCGGTPAAGHGP